MGTEVGPNQVVDIEALKEATEWIESFQVSIDPIVVRWSQVIIDALEDRERLRVAAEEVRYEIDRQLSLSEVPQLRQIEWWRGRLQTALERRDG